jgi:hypothetical protein
MRTWGRIPVRDKPMTSCGVPASQTHNSVVAGSGHKFYTMNMGQKGLGSRARVEKDKTTACISGLRNQPIGFIFFRAPDN